jgi:hypothetical protein
MNFDLTPEIILDEKKQRIYFYSKIILYFLAFVVAALLLLNIVFSSKFFTYSFLKPAGTASGISIPRKEDGSNLERGSINAAENFYFDSALLGNFSQVQVKFKLNNNSSNINGESVLIKKSYQALLYPEGSPMGFRDGTLLKNSANFYIVSEEKLRNFQNEALLSELGFSQEAFQEVSSEDLKYNQIGERITDSNTYPDSSLFRISDDFYALKNGQLQKFISQKAYLSQYSENQAIQKDAAFFNTYPLSETQIGFGDGSLLVYGESVYLTSGNNFFPIDSVATFEAMGFNWDDLILASGEEISFYAKDKLLNISGVHPNGTVFYVTGEDGSVRWYLIKNRKKHLLPSGKIANSWLKKTPISGEFESLFRFSECRFKEKGIFYKSFTCDAPIDGLQKSTGKDYEFSLAFNENVRIDSIDLEFKKTYTFSNFKRFVNNVITGLINTYVPKR